MRPGDGLQVVWYRVPWVWVSLVALPAGVAVALWVNSDRARPTSAKVLETEPTPTTRAGVPVPPAIAEPTHPSAGAASDAAREIRTRDAVARICDGVEGRILTSSRKGDVTLKVGEVKDSILLRASGPKEKLFDFAVDLNENGREDDHFTDIGLGVFGVWCGQYGTGCAATEPGFSYSGPKYGYRDFKTAATGLGWETERTSEEVICVPKREVSLSGTQVTLRLITWSRREGVIRFPWVRYQFESPVGSRTLDDFRRVYMPHAPVK